MKKVNHLQRWGAKSRVPILLNPLNSGSPDYLLYAFIYILLIIVACTKWLIRTSNDKRSMQYKTYPEVKEEWLYPNRYNPFLIIFLKITGKNREVMPLKRKQVEKGKLSERIGRKVMGLKYCHCELTESRRSNLIQ